MKYCNGLNAENRYGFFAPMLLVGITVAVFVSGSSAVFVYDGERAIVHNRSIRDIWRLDQVLSPPTTVVTVGGRPFLNLSFAMNYALDGADPRGYFAVNLVIHVCAGLILYAIVQRTLRLPPLQTHFAHSADAVALAAAVIWTIHPLQTESVTYLVQRAESLAGLLYLLVVYAVIRGAESRQSAGWYILAVVACWLGVLTKETVVTAPLFVLIYDRAFLSKNLRDALRHRSRLYVGLAASWCISAYLLYSGRVTDPSTLIEYAGGGISALEYARTQPEVILHYLKLAVWPDPLCADHGWPVSTSLSRIAVSVLTIGVLLALTFIGLVQNKPWSLLLTWFFVILMPTSSMLPLRQIAFEHRMYLPLASLAVGFAVGVNLLLGGLSRMARQTEVSATNLGTARISVFALIIIPIVLALGGITTARNTVYSDPIWFWHDVVAKSPHNLQALSNLGLALDAAGDRGAAHGCYRRAVELWFESKRPQGSAESRIVQRAPGSDTAVVNPMLQLGIRAMNAGDFAEATRLLEALVHLPRLPTTNDEPAKVFYNYALLLRKLGKPHEAERSLRHALSSNAGYGSAYNELALLLADSGRFDEAVEPLTTALTLPLPAERRARYAFNLASIHVERGDLSAAERQLAIACVAAPSQADYARALEAVRSRRSKDVVDPEAQTPTTATSQEAVP